MPGLDTVVYGVIVAVVILFMPHGAVKWFRERRAARRSVRVGLAAS